MLRFISYLLCLVALFISSTLLAQETPPTSSTLPNPADTIRPNPKALPVSRPNLLPPSPNAASLGRYGELPVNLSSGLPNPVLPLWTGTDKDISWPISLAYNYPGFIPASPAGPTGHGWSLMAGGVVTRTVRGLPDEKNQGLNGEQGYLFSRTQITNFVNPDGTITCTENTCPVGFSDGVKDGQPDLFSFSFGAYQGKFFFGSDGQPHLVSDRDLKIQFRRINQATMVSGSIFDTILGWEITTEDGTIYKFGMPLFHDLAEGPRNVELTYSTGVDGSEASQQLITTWHLYEITSPQAGKITFTSAIPTLEAITR